MYYDYYQSAPCEYDDIFSKGTYSMNPTSSSSQEAILIYLRDLAFYLLKLDVLGAKNEVIKKDIIEAISGIITHIDYNQNSFQGIITTLAQDLSHTRALYARLCTEKGIIPEFLKAHFSYANTSDILDIVKKSENFYIKRNAAYTYDEKNLFDIMLSLIKNICVKIIQIRNYKISYDNAYHTILVLLNSMNLATIETENIKSTIESCTKEYYALEKMLFEAQEKTYGNRDQVHISFASRNGKAILVSGMDMMQLEMILEATKGRGVDIYTHGIIMLMAHTLEKFKSYPHLVGHFGKGYDNSLFDFAAFPGAILMTRYLFQKVEYLYRGSLFTTDSFAPKGVVQIENNNFEPLIRAALDLKGFTKHEQEVIKKVGFRQQEMTKKIEEIVLKMEKKEIKHFYIIGLLNDSSDYKEYFSKFLALMPKDCYAFSLAYDKNEENILHIDSLFDYLFVYWLLDKINSLKKSEKLDISVFITKCDQYTITNIIHFTNMGIKNIFLCQCIPSLLNPALAATMRKIFGVKEFSTPEADLQNTLSK